MTTYRIIKEPNVFKQGDYYYTIQRKNIFGWRSLGFICKTYEDARYKLESMRAEPAVLYSDE